VPIAADSRRDRGGDLERMTGKSEVIRWNKSKLVGEESGLSMQIAIQ
jgi:hypothetical protein